MRLDAKYSTNCTNPTVVKEMGLARVAEAQLGCAHRTWASPEGWLLSCDAHLAPLLPDLPPCFGLTGCQYNGHPALSWTMNLHKLESKKKSPSLSLFYVSNFFSSISS